MKLFDFFVGMILYKSFFLLLLNDLLIIVFNSIKKHIIKVCKLTYNNKNQYDEVIIVRNRRKKWNRFRIKNKNLFRYFIGIIKYITLLNLLNNTFINNKIPSIEYLSYNITLKIKGIGNKKIFSSFSWFKPEYHPTKVYINKKNKLVVPIHHLAQKDNFIELIWNNLISSSAYMFYGCSDITEIDFSNFNTSNIENMESMFRDCSSLTSLNLSNFDTFKVTRMNNMFFGCSSLTSLNLSIFDTSNVEMIYDMFKDCISLEYINMINFNELSLDNNRYSGMFYLVPDNIVVCVN